MYLKTCSLDNGTLVDVLFAYLSIQLETALFPYSLEYKTEL